MEIKFDPESHDVAIRLGKFEKDLRKLINQHSLENLIDMSDILIANMLVDIFHRISIAVRSSKEKI